MPAALSNLPIGEHQPELYRQRMDQSAQEQSAILNTLVVERGTQPLVPPRGPILNTISLFLVFFKTSMPTSSQCSVAKRILHLLALVVPTIFRCSNGSTWKSTSVQRQSTLVSDSLTRQPFKTRNLNWASNPYATLPQVAPSIPFTSLCISTLRSKGNAVINPRQSVSSPWGQSTKLDQQKCKIRPHAFTIACNLSKHP